MRLTLYSNDQNYDQLLYYMYKEHSDKINEFSYIKATFIKNYSWKERFNRENKTKICHPCDTKFTIIYKQKEVEFCLQTIRRSGGERMKILIPNGCSTNEDIIYKKASLIGESKDNDNILQVFLPIEYHQDGDILEKINEISDKIVDGEANITAKIEVICKKFNYNDKKIVIIGRLIED